MQTRIFIIINPVFSVSRSFTNNSNMLIENQYENDLFLTDSKRLKAGVLVTNIQMQPLCALCNRP